MKPGTKPATNMNLQQRTSILISLGNEMSDICQNQELYNFPGFEKIYHSNPWFTEEFVRFSMVEWSKNLSADNIIKWISKYSIPDKYNNLCLGIVMAGNIPMVGFHDFISGFICGVNLKIKFSSKDNILMKWLVERVTQKCLDGDQIIEISENRVQDFDAIIATGSNNTNRYFEYYFSSYPNILRRNRNSVAILTGDESSEELQALADDVFVYFGFGCRNVSKLYIPRDYDFNKLAQAFQKYIHLKNYSKYANNLDYQYAVLAMNNILHVNPGNIYLVEKNDIAAPVGVINYEYYTDIEVVKAFLIENSEKIQCVLSNHIEFSDKLAFGESQKPSLCDYADNIDTISFILNLKK